MEQTSVPSSELCVDCPQMEVSEVEVPYGGVVKAGAWICKVTGKPICEMTECPEELDQ